QHLVEPDALLARSGTLRIRTVRRRQVATELGEQERRARRGADQRVARRVVASPIVADHALDERRALLVAQWPETHRRRAFPELLVLREHGEARARRLVFLAVG